MTSSFRSPGDSHNEARCETCANFGFYLDERCLDGTCAHAGRKRSPSEMKKLRDAAKPGETVSQHEPMAMLCPSRPCHCSHGDGPRAEQRERIALQAKRLAGQGWLS